MREVLVNGSYCRQYPIINEDIVESCEAMVAAIKNETISLNKINLVCTGTSGLYIATVMKMIDQNLFDILYIRKEGTSSHSGPIIRKENNGAMTHLWVDDFIASGATYRRCRDEMKKRGLRITHVMTLGGGKESEMLEDNVKIHFTGN